MANEAHASFWGCYHKLPREIQSLADKNFSLVKSDTRHPSVRLKKVSDDLWSARVGLHYRALATDGADDCLIWFWIGHYRDYDRMI